MPSVLVCETVTGATMPELLAARDAAVGGDLVELRLDGVAGLDVGAALAGRPRAAIATCRPAWEGGRYAGSEPARIALLNEAIEAGTEFVDVEWRADRSGLRSGARLVLSFHDFDGVPDDLDRRIAGMRSSRPAVVKIAVAARRLSDCVAIRQLSSGGGQQVVIAMGPAGVLTRVCPWLFGSCWTYGGSAAPGQIAASELRTRYRVTETSTATRLFGAIGPWAAATALAAAHNAVFADRGIDAVSVPLAACDDRDLDETARAFAIAGVSAAGSVPAGDELADRAAVDVARWIDGAPKDL